MNGPEYRFGHVPSHRMPTSFDEPCLGIVGMWRQGGGANPHFALALAETMLRVGQRYVAWTAYERASRLAERFWPDDAMRPRPSTISPIRGRAIGVKSYCG